MFKIIRAFKERPSKKRVLEKININTQFEEKPRSTPKKSRAK